TVVEVHESNFYNESLCSNTSSDRTCVPNEKLQSKQNIVISCSANATDFPDDSYSILALGLPNKTQGQSIQSAIVLINDKEFIDMNGNRFNPFNSLDRDKKIAVLAHEIGHAIGI